MGIAEVLLVFLLLVSMLLEGCLAVRTKECSFPAIFNFGDSNSDTGAISAAFMPISPPNGETYFGKPSGRACDGRLIIDLIADNLGLPYLSAYLDSIETNYRHGANFATGGSTIRPQDKTLLQGGFSPFPLAVQLWQFSQFKTRTGDLINNQGENPSKRYPTQEDFYNALYTLDIGQNDLSAGFRSMSDDQVLATIPDILNQFSDVVQQLYSLGGRFFWIHNTGPIGCLPYSVIFNPLKPNNLDRYGCVKSQNDIAQEFNRQLKERVTQLRHQLPDASLTYVDVYTAKYTLITDAKNQGFTDPFKYCCGLHEEGGKHVDCGKKTVVNGTEFYGSSCENPSMHVSWDGVHYSHAANQWVASHILTGSLSDPGFPITQACYRSV